MHVITKGPLLNVKVNLVPNRAALTTEYFASQLITQKRHQFKNTVNGIWENVKALLLIAGLDIKRPNQREARWNQGFWL